jgi:hypothetical protein
LKFKVGMYLLIKNYRWKLHIPILKQCILISFDTTKLNQ